MITTSVTLLLFTVVGAVTYARGDRELACIIWSFAGGFATGVTMREWTSR